MRTELIIALAAVLLASQVAVIIVLIVLCKRFTTLKQEVHKYKIKKNRESLSGLIIKDPKGKKVPLGNQYVDGKRHPTTLVRENSKESIVYVPTPAPERRSKNFGDPESGYELNVMQNSYNEAVGVNSSYTQDEEDEVYGNQVVIDRFENSAEADQTCCSGMDSKASTSNDPDTPCIEEVNMNTGYTQDTEEIYGNQVVIDMAERSTAGSNSVHDVQMNTSHLSTARNSTKSKKGKSKSGSKKVMSQKFDTSIESERTIEAGDSFYEGDSTDVKNEPIYENLREQMATTTEA